MSNHNMLDDQLDRIVDTQQVSYSEAYAQLGVPVPPIKPIMHDATAQRVADYEQYTRENNLTGFTKRTPEKQQEAQQRAHLGAASVMAALEAAKQEKAK